MILEEIIEILSRQRHRHFVARRNVEPASSIAKSYKTYLIELWEVKDSGNEILYTSRATGMFTEWHKEALVKKAEENFMEDLFKYLEEKNE